MTDTDSCPDPAGLDEKARLALAVIFGQVSDATSSPAVEMWAHSCEDRLLGYDEPAVPLDALSTPELCAVHPILVAAAAAGTDVAYRRWLIDLGGMITRQLDVRTADQMLIDARAATIDAAEQRIARQGRRPENLTGLPSWSETSGPTPDKGEGITVTSPQRFWRRVIVRVMSAGVHILAAVRRCLLLVGRRW